MLRPEQVKSTTQRVKTGCGLLYITKSDPGEHQEIFLRMGKCGGCALAFLDGISRLISKGLNKPFTWELVIEAFQGIRCPSPMWDGPTQILSCLDGVAQKLKKDCPHEDT